MTLICVVAVIGAWNVGKGSYRIVRDLAQLRRGVDLIRDRKKSNGH